MRTTLLSRLAYELYDLVLAYLSHLADARKESLVAQRTAVVDLEKHNIGEVEVLGELAGDKDVEIQL